MRRDDGLQLYCVELRTKDWNASVTWYRNVLGLKVLVRVVDDGYALLGGSGTRLAILARDKPGDATRRISLAFEVQDLTTVVRRFRDFQIPFDGGTTDGEGLRDINTLDPDGNRIRIFSWPRGK